MKPGTLLTWILTVLLAGGVAAQAQRSVLMLVDESHASFPNVEEYSNWLEANGNYTVSFSGAGLINNDPLANSAEFESYDLLIVPRSGAGASGDYGSRDWNQLQVPILNHNPFMFNSVNRWGWDTSTGTGNARTADSFAIEVFDVDHPVFSGMNVNQGDRIDILEPGVSIRHQINEIGTFTGHVAARTIDDNDPDFDDKAWIVTWSGDEGAFHTGSNPGEVHHRRAFFFTGDASPADNLTTDGQQLLLNTIDQTAIPEPGTVALWIGLSAVGGVMIFRRKRRKTGI